MKKSIFTTFFVLNIGLLGSALAADDMSQMSGYYVDEDIVDGKIVSNGFHSQAMNEKEYKTYVRNAAIEVVTSFCSEDKFVNRDLDTLRNKILTADKNLCDSILKMPLNSFEKQVAVINIYKENICARHVNAEFNSIGASLPVGPKEQFLSNCKSNPKQLTFKELAAYNVRTVGALNGGFSTIDPVNSLLGTLGPNGGFGFNFGSGSSIPSPGVWNFNEGIKEDGDSGISVDDAIAEGSEVSVN